MADPPTTTSPLSTGIGAVDELLGGLLPGDNVVWIVDDDVYSAVTGRFVDANGRGVLHVRTAASGVGRGKEDVDAGDVDAEDVDASARSALARPGPLADELERRVRDRPGAVVVVDDLAVLASRWGVEVALTFFARCCPTMLQLGSVAYWHVPRSLGPAGLEAIRQVTQFVLEIRNGRLHVHKAEGRPAHVAGSVHRARLDGSDLVVHLDRAGGRLARGLATVRRDLGLTQAELAAAGGVTASAVSQAENGARGLSIDTLVAMADHLGLPLDRFVGGAPDPGYRLTRHDRSRVVSGTGTVALADDATVGLRAFLVPLGPNGAGTPPLAHRGVELVVVNRGLVQVDVGEDRPVLRPGDTLLAVADGVAGWRNLRPEPALLTWILRD